MIQPDHPTLSIVQQCRLASIGRSTFYHVPRGESAENLGLMVEIDRQFLETPFYGAQCKRRRENPSLKRPESLVAPEQKCLGR